MLFEGAYTSDEKPDSIQLAENRFKSNGIGGSEIEFTLLYPNRWDLVNKFEDFGGR